jgi:hypothetical protein
MLLLSGNEGRSLLYGGGHQLEGQRDTKIVITASQWQGQSFLEPSLTVLADWILR